jgi:hypothetical protein
MFPKSNYASIQLSEHQPKLKLIKTSEERPTVTSKDAKVKIHKIYGAAQGKAKNYMSHS